VTEDDEQFTSCPIRFNGQTLDSAVSAGWVNDQLTLVLESRSGSKSGGMARNPDYLIALELILERLSLGCAVIERIDVVSRHALKLAPQERVLPMRFPIELHPSGDMNALRLNITETQRQTARTEAAKDAAGGNNTKRIRIDIRFPHSIPASLEAARVLLQDG
jgi:hypothetical protein